jgi:hypothetical protein
VAESQAVPWDDSDKCDSVWAAEIVRGQGEGLEALLQVSLEKMDEVG